MERATFFRCVKTPSQYTLHDKLDIQSEKSKYPYCSVLQMMDLMSDKAVCIYNWNERFFRRVSLHLLDNDLLEEKLALVQETKIVTPEDIKLKQQIENAKKKEYASLSEDYFDVMDEINSYQDVLSFKTAPKSVIIEKFLESEGEKKHIEEEKKEENGCKKNSSALRNAYHTACLNNSKSELQEQADKICDSIFNGIERAKELGI
jgi:hypothetical protein